MKARFAMLLVANAVLTPGALAHKSGVEQIEEVVVYGRSMQMIGVARAASEGVVGYDDYAAPPLLRAGELLEAVPGMVATQHSGTGKANQYFLRGFNLDHGTDFAGFAEGVPLNLRTHGHGQGYLDLNWVIPELVERTNFRKGPYSADIGDFGSAGSANIDFYERIAEPYVTGIVGYDDYARGVAVGSLDTGLGVVTGALDATRYDGPWDIPEDLHDYKGYFALASKLGELDAKLSFQAYDNRWDATDQIPLRAVEDAQIDRLGYIDPDLGGDTSRYAVTGSLSHEAWLVSAYAIRYDLSLFSNFTYFLADPTDGDEFEQRDDRTVFGGFARQAWDLTLAQLPIAARVGADIRRDDIDELGLFHTVSRSRIGTLRDDDVTETSYSVFGEAEVTFNDRLRGTFGLREDLYVYDVNSVLPVNSGDGNDSLLQPKVMLAYRLTDSVETYLSWGRGFHSNDVRGATIRIDPATLDPADPVNVLVESDGAEVGLRFEDGNTFNTTVTAFWLELDSELVFVGDAGTTEPNDATERLGIEITAFWQPTEWLAANVAYTYTHARFENAPSDANEIPGAVESVAAAGLVAHWANGFSLSLRARYLGEAPLLEDASVRAPDSLLVNLGAAYRRGPLEMRLDAFNLTDSHDYDISYYYESRLENESAGVEDVHFHPLEPFTMRAGVTWYL